MPEQPDEQSNKEGGGKIIIVAHTAHSLRRFATVQCAATVPLLCQCCATAAPARYYLVWFPNPRGSGDLTRYYQVPLLYHFSTTMPPPPKYYNAINQTEQNHQLLVEVVVEYFCFGSQDSKETLH